MITTAENYFRRYKLTFFCQEDFDFSIRILRKLQSSNQICLKSFQVKFSVLWSLKKIWDFSMQRFRICVFQVYLYFHELEVSPGLIWSHVYFIWSILHLLLRVYLIVISASKVHEAAHAPLTFVESLSNYEPRVIKVVPKSLRKLLYFSPFFPACQLWNEAEIVNLWLDRIWLFCGTTRSHSRGNLTT